MGALYNEGLGGIDGLQLPAQKDWAQVNYWMYAVVLDKSRGMDAVAFADALKKTGIETRPFFLGMHEQPVFRGMGIFQGRKLPVTERLHRQGLYLPSGLALTESQIAEVVGAVKKVLS